MEKNGDCFSLFQTKTSRGTFLFKLYVSSIALCVCLTWVFRLLHLPPKDLLLHRWVWIGSFLAELWFTFYWLITQIVRWNPTYRYTFKDRLSQRYEEDMPGVDIFVCTADPENEPPIMVINTVLSVMAYNYPPEKLSVYLSDDGGSELTFYALLEASRFSNHWLPFCKRYKVEPRSPEAYFRIASQPIDDDQLKAKDWLFIKESYEEMKKKIESAKLQGKISENIRKQHKGFRQWDVVSSPRDHQTIFQILIHGRDPQAVDTEGQPLPTLVYLAREKRPQHPHNFKAGAMNALIRVSSRISNAPIILNVDCDMYSNNSESVRDALCFFLDEKEGHRIAYVQYPQSFDNITKNDLYAGSLNVIMGVEIHGFDANGGPCYIGTGCFHRRETLLGKKYNEESKAEWKRSNEIKTDENAGLLKETCKILASCTYEEKTQWGKEMGIKYGCAVEDIMTGLAIQCRGWRSIYYNPERKGFLGVAPTTLLQSLVQHKRWSEGDLQIFLSQYCPFLHGHKKIPLKLQLSYCLFLLWAPNCLATLYYVVVPSLCLLRGVYLFPKISSLWVLPFAYIFFASRAYSLREFIWCGGTFLGWWNDQRMWVFKRTTSYLFGLLDNILKLMGISNSGFVVTAKVADEEVSLRYEQEMIEFGYPSPMFNILATLSLLNMFSFIWGIRMVIKDFKSEILDLFALQILLCGLLVSINLPMYKGLFFRKDSGRMPTSITYQSIAFALLTCSMAIY
ncbi:cellulose synthase-like protein E6 [Tripterygium wilfordii]|uniref:cellulose synthase-like protein E6 n=1 Tax=Tripterygium wilfordii TaxID=458696 RepID=UPI0018F8442E|nr:cellulose synthase-like protein E6 [Tripterygium wilfordii]